MAIKPTKPAGNEQVQAFLDGLVHPFKTEIEQVRKIILAASPALTEGIKWNAPSFCHKGEDRITLNLQGKDHFKLIFHCGAKAKARGTTARLIDDETGLLEWPAPDRAFLKLGNRDDVAAKALAIALLVNAWIRAAPGGAS